MKVISRKIFLGSLTSLAALASGLAVAEEMVTAPSFEGGLTASIGTFYVVPSADNTDYTNAITFTPETNIDIINAESDYDFGFEASLGYIFEDTANGIELSYRGLDTDNTSSVSDIDTFSAGIVAEAEDALSYDFNAVDLMIGQYIDVGTHMQLRISGGLSYLDLEQNQDVNIEFFEGGAKTISRAQPAPLPGLGDVVAVQEKSEFTGWGPRVAMDARYDFGEDLAGFGIVGGASLAYYLGTTDVTGDFTSSSTNAKKAFTTASASVEDNLDNQAVTNLRANLGIDYVYFFDNDERSTLGLELGYLVDFYDDVVSSYDTVTIENDSEQAFAAFSPESNSVTFSGPYLLLKGVF